MTSFFVFLSIFCAILSGNAFAANEEAYDSLILKYVQAINSHDDTTILAAWAELNKVPEATAYMEKTFPPVAYSFKRIERTIKLTDALKKFLDSYPNAPLLPESYSTQTYIKRRKLTNADVVEGTKNQNQLSNQEQAERDRRAGLVNNQNAAANSTNQTQRSNSDLINDEIDRMRAWNY